jgi:hypothetical protein
MGYTVQVGAFSNLTNAVRLSETLVQRDLNAYYFIHREGLYKVRFGNFASKESARKTAENLHALGVIHEYYIVGPEDYPHDNRPGRPYLRSEIVRTAKSFLNVPYRWGGASPTRGFDCSGFSMTVYQLNGLNLPRSSKAQWEAGMSIDHNQLLEGDLVFFTTRGTGEVSHVGIYLLQRAAQARSRTWASISVTITSSMHRVGVKGYASIRLMINIIDGILSG